MTVEAAIREILRIRRRSLVQLSVTRKPDDSVALVLATDGGEYHFPVVGNTVKDSSGNVYSKPDEWQTFDLQAAIKRNSPKNATGKTRKAS